MSAYLTSLFAGRLLDGGLGWPSPSTVAQSWLSPESRSATSGDRFYAETVYPLRLTVSLGGPADAVTNIIASNAQIDGQYTARLESFGQPGSVTFSFRHSPDVVVPVEASSVARTRTDWAAGSFGRACCTAVDAIIAGRTPGAAARQIYSSLAGGALTRNPDCILPAEIDVTCWSTWNSYHGRHRAGTAITPRHIVCADHFALPDGTTLHFQAASPSGHFTRSIVSSAKVGTSDIRVCLLDADLPDDVTPANILPDDWPNYITVIAGLPHITTNSLREIKVSAGTDVSLPPAPSAVRWYSVSPAGFAGITGSAARTPWYSPAIAGDSGAPAFLLVGGQLILLSIFHIATGGSALHSFATEIDDTIGMLDAAAAIDTGYTMTRADLSPFPAYT